MFVLARRQTGTVGRELHLVVAARFTDVCRACAVAAVPHELARQDRRSSRCDRRAFPATRRSSRVCRVSADSRMKTFPATGRGSPVSCRVRASNRCATSVARAGTSTGRRRVDGDEGRRSRPCPSSAAASVPAVRRGVAVDADVDGARSRPRRCASRGTAPSGSGRTPCALARRGSALVSASGVPPVTGTMITPALVPNTIVRPETRRRR